jgi:hypothetical protein
MGRSVTACFPLDFPRAPEGLAAGRARRPALNLLPTFLLMIRAPMRR